jgi:hypothetical protein
MRKISSKTHAYLDFALGILLIGMPWLLGFQSVTSATVVSVGAGIILILLNLATRHELGVAPMISLPGHLQMDAALGTLLGLAPWIVDFHTTVYLPHLFVALCIAVLGFITSPLTAEEMEDAQQES